MLHEVVYLRNHPQDTRIHETLPNIANTNSIFVELSKELRSAELHGIIHIFLNKKITCYLLDSQNGKQTYLDIVITVLFMGAEKNFVSFMRKMLSINSHTMRT